MLKYSKIVFIFVVTIFSINILAEAPDPIRSKNGMVVSANELASKVGLQILRRGGNAVDAAVATGFALAVTYPSAGNLGGGGFMVIHLNDGRNIAIDYREKAPLAAYKDMYLDDSGNFLMELSTRGATASGVPGSVAGLIHALENYGTMTLAEVLQPAINLAQDGFQLDYSLARSFQFALRSMDEYESSMKVFSKNGTPYIEGEIFKQPDLANTLKLIKENGKDGFYKGKTAELIVNQVQSMGGYISFEDLEKYEAVERTPITGSYRGHKIISMPPSSSGGLVLLQMLNVLENFNFTKEEWGSSKYIHTLSEAMKFAYADRSVHIGDEDFYDVPKDWLISKEYAKKIADKISDSAIPSSKITAGIPFAINESEETTHYSVCDAFGNAVSTTTTINSSYGNKLVVDGAGFLLNNEMDDFSSKPGEPNQFGLLGGEANSIQPEKRMLSAMTPTIVLKDDKPSLVVGSPGGSTIITVVLQVILNCIDFEMDIQDAINQPRIHHQWLPERIDYEQFGMTVDVKENLQSKGHIIGRQRSLGRAEGIMVDHENNLFFGATDPRGYGSAEGF